MRHTHRHAYTHTYTHTDTHTLLQVYVKKFHSFPTDMFQLHSFDVLSMQYHRDKVGREGKKEKDKGEGRPRVRTLYS